MICAKHLKWYPQCYGKWQLHEPLEECEPLDSPVVDRAMAGYHGGEVDQDELMKIIDRERNSLELIERYRKEPWRLSNNRGPFADLEGRPYGI